MDSPYVHPHTFPRYHMHGMHRRVLGIRAIAKELRRGSAWRVTIGVGMGGGGGGGLRGLEPPKIL